MHPARLSRGFTLAELTLSLALLGIITALAAPSFTSLIERQRLAGATELVYSQFTFARNEAVKRSKPIVVSFTATGSSRWAFGITDRLGGCDPNLADPEAPDSCSIDLDNDPATPDRALYRFTSEGYPDVYLPSPSFGVAQTIPCASGLSASETCFDPNRGIARNGSANFVTARYAASAKLSTLGRVRVCTPAGRPSLPGYPKC